MTPTLQQAIKLLQMTRLELQDVVNQEIVANPVLEEDEATEAPAGAEAEEAGVQRENNEAAGTPDRPVEGPEGRDGASSGTWDEGSAPVRRGGPAAPGAREPPRRRSRPSRRRSRSKRSTSSPTSATTSRGARRRPPG